VQNREMLVALLKSIFIQKSADEWTAALLNAGIPSGPINQIADAFADPQVQARGLVHQVEMENGEVLEMVGPPVKFSETPPTIRHAPPLLGQDTELVLMEWLDLSSATVEDYRKRGII
jgi:crotonobetainyl-CoA:carnitine CoA-transferase CaiB-like acyl-CoA transferase